MYRKVVKSDLDEESKEFDDNKEENAYKQSKCQN